MLTKDEICTVLRAVIKGYEVLYDDNRIVITPPMPAYFSNWYDGIGTIEEQSLGTPTFFFANDPHMIVNWFDNKCISKDLFQFRKFENISWELI